MELIVDVDDMKVMAEYWLNQVHLAKPVKVTGFEQKETTRNYGGGDQEFKITYEPVPEPLPSSLPASPLSSLDKHP